MQAPSGIPPSEIDLLHIVSTIADADSELSAAEVEFMTEEFSKLYANDEEEKLLLRQEIQSYLSLPVPLEQLVAKLSGMGERELALKLSYMVIQVGSGEWGKSQINKAEKVVYRQLVQLLDIPEDRIEAIEWEADRELNEHSQPLEGLIHRFAEFFNRR
jgi:hypothetical protein